VLLSCLLAACGPGPVGYQGSLPSIAARRTLADLVGKSFPPGTVAFTAREVRVAGSVVGPNGLTLFVDESGAAEAGRTPRRHWIPLQTDGDVADLHRRLTGTTPAGLGGDLSSAYRRTMTGR
jgi:hypothetical protein